MKRIYAFALCFILAALAATSQTPPPLEVQLSEPITATVTNTESAKVSEVTVEWLLLTPGEASLVAKIQPSNTETRISGDDYAALVSVIESKVRAGKSLRDAFAEALQPAIQDGLTP